MGIGGKVLTSGRLLFKHFIELSVMVLYDHDKSLAFRFIAGMIQKHSLKKHSNCKKRNS